MTMTLRGKVAVVTGASAGIGLAITEALAAEGAYVVAGARHSSPGLDVLAAGGWRLAAASVSTKLISPRPRVRPVSSPSPRDRWTSWSTT